MTLGAVCGKTGARATYDKCTTARCQFQCLKMSGTEMGLLVSQVKLEHLNLYPVLCRLVTLCGSLRDFRNPSERVRICTIVNEVEPRLLLHSFRPDHNGF